MRSKIRMQKITVRDGFLAMSDSILGQEIKVPNQDRFVLISEDASEPGRVRATYFQPNGFQGHITRDTLKVLIDEVVWDGYIELCSGALDRLSQSPEWAKGMEQLSAITDLNDDKVSYPEFLERMAVIDKAYSVAA